ncbi:hypothetical protein [Bradyrhizobium sp. 150]|uniref:hypothetical protein n=1 Tax=Bradyrhizobium sp. 150 TaxID=2782625 RepID=UPI001FF7E666|nr:hypothetical protein [Bradyrhizobium sp. 150]MCK1670402.1 hypothetical protein [Bradyrhizobium sp. 150]
MAHAAAEHSTTRKANKACVKELRLLARVEADLEDARGSGTIEDVFLTLEEIYSTRMHTEHQTVRAKCELILRAGQIARA